MSPGAWAKLHPGPAGHAPHAASSEGLPVLSLGPCGTPAYARPAGRRGGSLRCLGGRGARSLWGQYCDICTAANSNRAHPVSNAVDGTERWWQSPPLSRGLEYNEVNVTLDLGQVFHVAYVIIKFANSPRPDLWVLERSTDFGLTYQPWQRDCLQHFGPHTLERIAADDAVVCSTEHSRIVPLENGEIVVSLVNGRPGALNFSYSPLLRDFTKATNIRLRFLRTNTLLGHLMGKALRDPTVTRRYYYSIKDISIGGRCVCHGHADVCDAKDPTDPFRLQCACQHNTCGGSCDRCCPGFHQQPWRPATSDSTNGCQPCNCHGHAHDCFYDPEVARRNASQNLDRVYQGGGVCVDCQHHTTGVNCERCLPGFYRDSDQPLHSPQACRRCNCESNFTDGTCEDLTGRCYCRPNFTGERCDACAEGFAGFPHCFAVSSVSPDDTGEQVLPAGQIVNCDCSAAGTQGNACRKDPRVGRCVCKPNFQGAHCELCAPGFYGPGCRPCLCSSPGVVEGACDPDSGRCTCRAGFEGAACDRCAPGYFHFPLCQLCGCSPAGTLPEGCDDAGRCHCRPEFQGPHCDRCRPGHHGYPDCRACTCDPRGALDQLCGAGGACRCRPGFAGPTCGECSPGHHGFPDCAPCRCHPEGSLHAVCDPRSGQCACRPRVAGLRCDACAPGAYDFPNCAGERVPRMRAGRARPGLRDDAPRGRSRGVTWPGRLPTAGSCHPAGLAPANPARPEAQALCACRAHVDGPSCDRCKPGFWGLSSGNPEGCSRCSCDPRGTLGGAAHCQQASGQCFCKPHVCGRTCAACKDSFFGLDRADYFGCRSCRCDVGGALGQGCEPRTGACRCRPNTQGPTCSEPARDHYLPDLHHLRLELEEAVTPQGRPVRFGFNPLEFENFSWRGYAQMTPIQPRVVARLNVTAPDLFRLVFRFANRGPSSVSGRVSVREDGASASCANCESAVPPPPRGPSPRVCGPGRQAWDTLCVTAPGTEQSQPMTFPPSTEPAFVTVPQRGFGEPFVLNPGAWSLLIEAEGVLLDYVVLLPSAYYEAALLQLPVTEACTYRPATQRAGENCLLYTHLPLDGFTSTSGLEALCRQDNSLPRPCPTEQLSPEHPPLAACLGSDVDVQLQVVVPRPGHYALVVEYANEDTRQEVDVAVHVPQQAPQQGTLTLHPCPYSTLCRGAALDAQHHLMSFLLDTEASVRLTAEQARFFLHGVTLVPVETFSSEFLEPRVRCISRHGTFTPSSAACLPSRFPKPPQAILLRDCQVLPLPPRLPLTHSQQLTPGEAPSGPQPRPPTAVDPDTEPTLLRHPQGTVVFTTQVPALGRYAIVLHGYQPAHPTFAVEVLVSGGRVWQGHANASFCPHGYGCRTLVVCEGQTVLDVTDSELTVTLRVPEGRWLWLEYVLVVPEAVYSPSYLREAPLDKSYDFISYCAAQGYHVSPSSSSAFCRTAAASLSLFYNNGARPCGCHEAGAIASTCEPFGGQCPCRAHVIGRDCSRCATGYWGFPNCRPCDCGGRLCDELSGLCLCPPRTLPPDCLVCRPQAFGCHPLAGCEECDCSGPGVQELTDPVCDADSGQCRCRPRVTGRRCDACAPGFHGFPVCRPCDCHAAGSLPGVCDPRTGQCRCKENVQGARCDQCRLGTFSLDAANPRGCTRCFCFGATEHCRSAAHGRRELVDMGGWMLLSGDRQQVPHELRVESELLHADLRRLPEASPELYWQAPPSYLGDRVSSYGGTLRYELHSETQRGDVFIPTESRPDVVLQGNQMSITFLEPEYPAPGQAHRGQLQLVEGSFRHVETHSPVSREELMMVLAGLEQLHIRALFSQVASAVSLRRVALEVAGEVGGGPPASSVELCMCPASYRGASCQECAPGHYRDIKGLFLGRCVPCQCHGHSDRCLPGTGVCVGCQHHTEGDHCELCAAGFVRAGPEHPAAPCISCPCPLSVPSNNFATGCVLRGGRTQCLCKPGYAGPSCERCAPGFFGNPMVLGSSCQACDCSGNGDPNLLFSDCDPLTGACRGCLRHTAGPRCEHCAPGFHGDALLPGGCTRCDCSPCGSEGCDPRSGRCLCKAGVKGPRCDRCQEGHFGFETCGGCQPCACGPAAESDECHPQSGQCRCRPGAGGPQCRDCAPGHWGHPEQGCRRCQCQGGHCDRHTGRCTCPPGLSGERCDTCSHQHQVPVPGGPGGHGVLCEVCSHCVVLLLDALERAGALLPAAHEQLHSRNASSGAWARLRQLEASVAQLQVRALRQPRRPRPHPGAPLTARSPQDRVRSPPGPPPRAQQQLEALEQQSARAQAGQLLHGTEATLGRAQSLLVGIQAAGRTLAALESQMDDLAPANASAPSGEQLRRALAEVERMLAEMRARHMGALARVQDQLTGRWEENQALAGRTREQLAQHESGLMDLREALNRAVAATREAEELNARNQERLEEALHRRQELAQDNATLRATLQAAGDTVAQLAALVLGMDQAREEYERLAANLDGAWSPLSEKIQAFSPAGDKVDLVEKAEAHARQLDQLALNLSSTIRGVNQDHFIQRAIEATNAYSSILRAVQDAKDAAGRALQEANHAWTAVVQGGLVRRAQEVQANGSALEAAILREQQELGGDEISRKIARGKAMAAEALDVAARVQSQLQDMQGCVDQWQGQYGALQSRDVDQVALDAGRSASSLEKTLPQLLAKLSVLENRGVHNASQALSASISRVRGLIAQARGAASKVGVGREAGGRQGGRGGVGWAAGKVKVPMKFNGTAGVRLRTPRDLADLAAYTSLKFYLQRLKLASSQAAGNQFVLYLGSRQVGATGAGGAQGSGAGPPDGSHLQADGDYLGVALRDGKVHWVYRLGGAGPATLSVDEDIGEQFAAVSVDRWEAAPAPRPAPPAQPPSPAPAPRSLQFGHMSVTVEKETVHETKGDTVAPGPEGLLSLRPDDFVFYVGGYPGNFTPPAPLNLPCFRGCIEMDTLNEEVLSLYNFEETFRLDTTADKPCARSKATGDPWLTDGSYLDGSGFARISVESQISSTKRFDLELRLAAPRLRPDAVRLRQRPAGGRPPHQRDAGAVPDRRQQGGEARGRGQAGAGAGAGAGGTPPALKPTWPQIQVFVLSKGAQNSKRVLVRVERATVFTVEANNTLELADTCYLGGVPPAQLPSSLRQRFPSGGSVRGCVKGIKVLGKYVDLKRLDTTGISFGCPNHLLVSPARPAHPPRGCAPHCAPHTALGPQIQRAATFHGHGFLPVTLPEVAPLWGHVYSGFGFRSTQDSGQLYHRAAPDGHCEVSLRQGRVALRLLNTELKTRGGFADGAPHYVAFYSNSTGVWLYVDDELQQKAPLGPLPAPRPRPRPLLGLLLGGSRAPSGSHNTHSFRGCVSNVFVQRLQGPQRVLDLKQSSGGVNVSSGCAPRMQASGPAPQGLQATAAQKASRRSRQPTDLACAPSGPLSTIPEAYQFGGALSGHLESRLSLLARPQAHQGLLVLTAPRTASARSLVLSLSHGHFVALAEGPGSALRVQSRQRARAGQWHMVSVQWARTRLQLVVDGVRVQAQAGPQQRHRRAEGSHPHVLFVGGLPAGHPALPVVGGAGFSGCVKTLRVDGRPLGAPTRAAGVTPCFSAPLEKGLFFTGSGGVLSLALPGATLPALGLELEVRPQTATGVLLHLGQSRAPPYLQLQLLDRQVLLQADNGAGAHATWVTRPAALCDGQWHRLAVTREGRELRLEVDGQRNHTLGRLPAASAWAPLHLGGLPEPPDTPAEPRAWTRPRPPTFRGCLRNLTVNGSPVPWPQSASVWGAVGTGGCPPP
ncbi:Laminin subunit alpha-5 [Galemys pyrenaicus]|uniref:Laminin subunit alpha-5 n=1 Tax=Galemys pyrenaicus TaxID=202257 RepID=A0A8J6A6S4_GALPY|nr:Laminin subunit alpha-5 [Galemys pyrenaicus]